MDRQGNFVTGLTKDDFEVLEDGKPQKVEMFSYVDLPVEKIDRMAFSGRPVVSDVKTNQQSLAGRFYVIVLDDLDTSLFRTATVRRTARQFLERNFGANDVAAVVYTSGRMDAAQEFTGDRSLLLSAVDKFVGRKLRSSMLDKIDQQFKVAENTALATSQADPNAAAPATNSGALSSGSSLDPTINPFTRGDGYPDRTFDTEDMERGFRAQRVLEEIKRPGGLHGERARPPESAAAVQRRHRLQHRRYLRGAGRHDDHQRHAGRDCGRGARQREHLRHRSARHGGHVGRRDEHGFTRSHR